MIQRVALALTALAVALVAMSVPRGGASAVVPINFTRATLSGSGFSTSAPTTLTIGPDGRLYVADGSGRIQALTLDPSTKAVTAVQEITTATDLQEVYGIAFDPNDASSPPPIYVTNTVSGFGDAGQAAPGSYPGKVTKISGAGYATRTDIITGLPVSNSGHQANGLAFGPDGRLYIGQGSTTNAGVVNPQAGLFQREEVPTSGAILVADIHAPAFNGNITYSPADTYGTSVVQTGGDVSVYAHGLRNPYDIAWHTNGRLYNTDNGPNAGYGPGSLTCTTSDGSDAQAADELNIIVAGDYYGHPNRNRGIAGDARQCDYHPGTDASTAEYTSPIALLPASSDGLAEYTYGGFGGQMQSDLLYVAWVDNTLHRVRLSGGGSAVAEDTTLATGLTMALDVAVGSDGTIYVAEWGANRVTFFKPDETPVGGITVTAVSPPGGPITGGQSVTITGTNFTTAADTTVTIGGVPLTGMAVQNSTTITGVTGAHAAGPANVTVTNSIGSATLTNGYNYTAGGGTQPPVADAGPDWSGPIAHNNHSHVTLDGRNSSDADGYIVTYEWREGTTLLSANAVDSLEFPLGEHLVTLTVTDNDGYTSTDQVRVIVTATAENPELWFCFDVDGDTDVDAADVTLVGAAYGKRFASTGYEAGYGRMYDYNVDRIVNSGDVLGTLSDTTASCPQLDREIRAATVWMEQYRNVNTAIAAGFVQITQWIPGQGRHMVQTNGGGVSGALGNQDTVFNPGQPESLLYVPDSTVPGGWRLGGGMWILPVTLLPLVPDGFTGNEDAWHYHQGLCLHSSGLAVAENTTQSQCFAIGGNIWLDKAGWLVHLWNFHGNPAGRFVEIDNALTAGASAGTATIAIDASPALPGVQSSASVSGGSVTIDVVASNIADVAAFNFDVEYDPAVLSGPTIGSGPSTDRNPDANQGFLQGTGRAFACTPPNPNGAVTLGTKKAARISCVSTGSAAGPSTGAGTAIASVTLNVVGSLGTGSSLALKNVNVFNSQVVEVASCNPTVSITATCAGASLLPASADGDGDGVPDQVDNCPAIANANQADGDADYLGNACEAAYGANAAVADSDGDGCRDGVEVHTHLFSPALGGDRNPSSPWDFYDVPAPAIRLGYVGQQRDHGVGVTTDVVALLAYAGLTQASADYMADYDGNQVPDGQQYDRSASTVPNKSWRSGSSDGGIGITTDVVAMLAQVGHSCTAPP